MKSVVMIPTYNERRNIKRLVDEILKLDIMDLEIIVVDDNSPDGTGKIVKDIADKNKKVHLLLRTKNKGRGLAGVAGFKKALENNADLIIEMDADFSHNPKDIPKLMEAAKKYDLVLGSRGIQGGSDKDRPFLRQMLTKLANFYIRVLLGLKVKDCNSGFRCFRRKVLEAINLDKVMARGPDIVQELLFKTKLKGFSISEVPIEFKERKQGTSKLGMKHLIKGYMMVLKLRAMKLFGVL